MKSNIKIFGLFLFLVIAFSCKKQDIPVKPQPSPFSVTAQSKSAVPANGGTVLVDIKAGSDGWWIVIPDDAKSWCTCSQVYGSGDKTVTLTIAKNSTGAGRTVAIQFNPTFSLPAETVTVEQE